MPHSSASPLVDLNGVEGGRVGGVDGQRTRRSLVLRSHSLNVDHGKVFIYEDYVQWDEGVFHPEAQYILTLKDEQHAAVLS